MASTLVREHAAHVLAVGIPVAMVGVGLLWDGLHSRHRRRSPKSGEPQPARNEHRPRDGRGGLALAAVASVGAAVVHLTVMPEHFGESALYGAFFLCAAIAQFACAGLLVMKPTRTLLWATVAGNAAIIALWLMTRLIEVPIGPGAGTTESFGVRDIVASGCELVTLVACLGWLVGRRDLIPAGYARIARPPVAPLGPADA